MGYEGLIGETISLRGHNGDLIEAYQSRPTWRVAACPGVVVIHHMPGWDEWTKEVDPQARPPRLRGDRAAPVLAPRPGRLGRRAARRVRAAGGVADAQVVGDVAGARRICCAPAVCQRQGRRDRLLLGRPPDLSGSRASSRTSTPPSIAGAARVIVKPEELNAERPVRADRHDAETCACPLLGIFGNDDANPDPEQVNRTEAVLKQARQRLRVPPLRRRRPWLLRRRPRRTIGPSRPSTAGRRSLRSSQRQLMERGSPARASVRVGRAALFLRGWSVGSASSNRG